MLVSPLERVCPHRLSTGRPAGRLEARADLGTPVQGWARRCRLGRAVPSIIAGRHISGAASSPDRRRPHPRPALSSRPSAERRKSKSSEPRASAAGWPSPAMSVTALCRAGFEFSRFESSPNDCGGHLRVVAGLELTPRKYVAYPTYMTRSQRHAKNPNQDRTAHQPIRTMRPRGP